MPQTTQRAATAHRAVLAHNCYAGVDTLSTSTEEQITELLCNLRCLCEEYNIDFEESSKSLLSPVS